MSSEIPLNTSGELKDNGSYSLSVMVSPENSRYKKIYSYKQVAAGLQVGTRFLLDDSGLEFDRYWDLEDKNASPRTSEGNYQIWAQAGDKHQGESVKDVWENLDEDETPLTLLEALYLIHQHPELIDTLHNSSLLVPATEALFGDVRGWFPNIKYKDKELTVDLVSASERNSEFRPLTRKI